MHQEPDLGPDMISQADGLTEFCPAGLRVTHYLNCICIYTELTDSNSGSIALGALTLIYNIELSEGRTEGLI